MTEERKKYMAGISYKEKLIREEIQIRKNRIKLFKEYINKENVIIKVLEKQIPAMAFEHNIHRFDDYVKLKYCCRCGCDNRLDQLYCGNCGQKFEVTK